MGIRHNHVAGGANDPTREVSRDRWNEDHLIDGELQLGGLPSDPAAPANGTLWLNTATGEVKVRSAGATVPLGAGGGGATDLSYDAASRLLSSSTGSDVTLPLADGTNAGLMSAADFNDLNTALQPGASIPWTDVSGKPATFAPSAHGHTAGEITGLAAVATTGSASDLGSGTLPAARFNDAAHGNRAGGTLHADAIAAGASGFMSGADKTKLNGIATGATANATDAALRDRATHTGTQAVGTITGLAAVATSGSASDLGAGTLPAARMPAQTGDVTAPAGSTVQTLATVNANVGSFGLAASVAQFTVNAKGLITSAANVAISIAASAISDSTAAGRAMLQAATAAAQTALLNTFTTSLKGLVPPPGTASGNFLRDDGTWAASGGGSPVTVQDEGTNITTALGTLNFVGAGVTVTGGATAVVTIPGGGGGGSPGGATGEIQFNNAGAFGGAADVEIEGGQLRLPVIAIPAVPAAGGLKLFGRSIGGRVLPSSIGPSGLDSPLQPHTGLNKVAWMMPPGNSNTIQNLGIIPAATGTLSAKNWASTNRYTKMRGLEYLITTAAANAVAGFRGSAAMFTVGSNAAEDGGFHLITRWGPATGVAVTTMRAFCGMRNSTAAPTDVNPSTLTNIVGMGWDDTDTNIQFMHNDASGVATKIDLGASFPVPTVDRTSVYEIAMFSPPGTTQSVSYRIRDLVSGAEATGTVTTDLPPTTTALNPYASMSTGTATVNVIGICLFSLYIETDY